MSVEIMDKKIPSDCRKNTFFRQPFASLIMLDAFY